MTLKEILIKLFGKIKAFFIYLKDIDLGNYYPLFFTIIFNIILLQYTFNTFDSIFYDNWVKWDLGQTRESPIVVITLDEESEQFLGETYPYTYATHLRFIKELILAKPMIINSFVNFLDPTNSVEEKYSENFKSEILKFIESGGAFRFSSTGDSLGEQLPPESLQEIGYSLGVLARDGESLGKDPVIRRAIINISGEDSTHLWTAKEYLKLKSESSPEIQGSYYVRESDASFSLFRYFTSPLERGGVISIPFHRVVVGNYPENLFKDKIVLIGPKYFSDSTSYQETPFNPNKALAPAMNIHGIIIHSLINNKTVAEIPLIFTKIMSLLIAFFLSYLISRYQPAKGLLVAITLIIFFVVSSYIIFVSTGYWLRISHIILSIFVVYYIWVPFRAIVEYQTRYAIEEETKIIKRVDRLKQNFISLMSHDLKTPVAKISGIADLLNTQYQNEPKQKELIQNIITSTKELNNFINSILDLTKIESRNLNLNKQSKDINSILEIIAKEVDFDARTGEVEIEMNLEPLYPIEVDTTLIKRVFSNLVGNAIKYSGKESKISISSWDDDDWVYIKIQDNGVGIEAEDLDHIFEKFYRVKNDASHKIKGSGLGLYLVKYFVELHNGKISVESEVGQGTAFIVQLVNA